MDFLEDKETLRVCVLQNIQARSVGSLYVQPAIDIFQVGAFLLRCNLLIFFFADIDHCRIGLQQIADAAGNQDVVFDVERLADGTRRSNLK